MCRTQSSDRLPNAVRRRSSRRDGRRSSGPGPQSTSARSRASRAAPPPRGNRHTDRDSGAPGSRRRSGGRRPSRSRTSEPCGRRASGRAPWASPKPVWARSSPPLKPASTTRSPGHPRTRWRDRMRWIHAARSPGHHRTARDDRPGTRRRIGGYPRAVTLQIDGLHKAFGPVVALDGLTFDVPAGEIFGFLGANGAGKTTTMRIALGVLAADRGEIRWHGADSRSLPRAAWGHLPEERGLYPRMVVLDQLVFFASLQGMPRDVARRRALDWLGRLRVTDLAGRRAEELSKGNQQKIQLISAVLHDPAVLLMDEPFTGLDPVNVALLRETLLELRDDGRTLIFSTHQMETVEAMCESIAIIDRGRLVVGGPLRQIKRESGHRLVKLSVDDDH